MLRPVFVAAALLMGASCEHASEPAPLRSDDHLAGALHSPSTSPSAATAPSPVGPTHSLVLGITGMH